MSMAVRWSSFLHPHSIFLPCFCLVTRPGQGSQPMGDWNHKAKEAFPSFKMFLSSQSTKELTGIPCSHYSALTSALYNCHYTLKTKSKDWQQNTMRSLQGLSRGKLEPETSESLHHPQFIHRTLVNRNWAAVHIGSWEKWSSEWAMCLEKLIYLLNAGLWAVWTWHIWSVLFFYFFSLHKDSPSFFPSNSAEGPLMVSEGCFQPRPSEMPRSMGDSTVLNLQHAIWKISVTGPSEWNPDH